MTDTGVKLYIMPRKVMTWEEFRAIMPPYSMALDGFVRGVTRRDSDGPYATFDHHEGVDRLITDCTAMQINMEINTGGLQEVFSKNGIVTANVYVNGGDEDLQTSWWQLEHHEAVKNPTDLEINARINRLVNAEDKLDRTAGMYKLKDAVMRRKMAWMFEPYQKARFERKLSDLDENGFKGIYNEVGKRINRYVFGDGGDEIPLEGSYKKIGGGTGWVLVEETGPAARMAMSVDGIKAYASIIERKADGSYVYSLGRTNPWVRYPLLNLYDRLNEIEGDRISKGNRWGGGDLTGGSPLITSSKISPEKLEEIIEKTVREEFKR